MANIPQVGSVPAHATTPDGLDIKPRPPTGKGSGANKGGPVPPVSTQPVRKAGRAAAADIPAETKAAIDEALAGIFNANVELKKAIEDPNKNADDVEATKTKLQIARAHLGQVIDDEAKRLSRSHPSPIAKGEPACTSVSQWKEKIVLAYAESSDLAEIKDQNRKNTELQTPRKLKALSAAMRRAKLNQAQALEKAAILADARDVVTGKRPEEAGLMQQEVAGKRLDRLDSLLNRATTVQEGSHPKDEEFDPKLYDQLTGVIWSGMGELSDDDRERFATTVSKYRIRLAP